MTVSVLSALFGAERAASARAWLLCGALALGALVFAAIVQPHYAIQQWLFFRYAAAASCAALFCVSALSVGNLIVSALSTQAELLEGRVTLGFACGVLAFGLAMHVVGLLGWVGPAAFYGVPLVLFALGARRASRDLVRLFVRRRGRPLALRLSAPELIGVAAGGVALALLYVPTLVPANLAYDARWYHLGLAEHYLAAGGIERMPEGATTGVIPQLATMLYLWGFSAPGTELFDRIAICAHLEFAVFLFTLPGVCLLFRQLVPEGRGRFAWLAVFLFPSIFMYDATLTVAADHIAALFAIPAYVCAIRALPELRPAACVLFTLQLVGLMMTKYTAVIAAAFPLLLVCARAGWLALERVRGRRRDLVWLQGMLCALGTGLVLTAPHWLKNWIWYGDPLYPLLYRHLSVRPWNPDAPFQLAAFQVDAWMAQGEWPERLRGTLGALYNYSYELYSWPNFHGRFPIFGSLFTCTLFALPFLGRVRPIWRLAIATHLGIAIWYLYFHFDRYLQTLLPWMAAAVAAILALSWRAGWPARVGVLGLCGLQLVWNLDLPFYPVHQVGGGSGIGMANTFFSRAYTGQLEERTKPFDDLGAIGRRLWPGARVLLHQEHMRLGLGVRTVSDAPRIQYGINYARLGSSRAVHRLLRSYGVTHVVWQRSLVYGDASLADDLVFHTYATRYLQLPITHGARTLAELPPVEPGDDGHTVFHFGCSDGYGNGLFELRDLSVSPLKVPGWQQLYPEPRQPLAGNLTDLLRQASHAVIDDKCQGAPQLEGFELIARYGTVRYLVRALNIE
jgi:hypothetical protein